MRTLVIIASVILLSCGASATAPREPAPHAGPPVVRLLAIAVRQQSVAQGASTELDARAMRTIDTGRHVAIDRGIQVSFAPSHVSPDFRVARDVEVVTRLDADQPAVVRGPDPQIRRTVENLWTVLGMATPPRFGSLRPGARARKRISPSVPVGGGRSIQMVYDFEYECVAVELVEGRRFARVVVRGTVRSLPVEVGGVVVSTEGTTTGTLSVALDDAATAEGTLRTTSETRTGPVDGDRPVVDRIEQSVWYSIGDPETTVDPAMRVARAAYWSANTDRCPPDAPGPEPVDEPGTTGLSREQVRSTVREHMLEARGCYERALLGWPDLSGRVVVQFRIEPDGHVATAGLLEDGLSFPRVGCCLARAVKRWSFPPAAGVTVVAYPFFLQQGAPD